MGTNEGRFGHWQTVALALIFAGIALTVVIDGMAWIGIAIMLTGLALSFVVLFGQSRNRRN